MIEFSCENCGQKFRVAEDKAGKKGKCPKCENPVVVPSLNKRPAGGAGTFSIICSMCDKTIQVPETSRGQTIECPECGSYIETSSGGALSGSEASVPLRSNEDIYQEETEEYEESEGVDRRIIVGISAVVAVVVVGLIILAAVLRSSGSRPAERPEGLRGQQQVADTDSRPQPVTSDSQPEEPVEAVPLPKPGDVVTNSIGMKLVYIPAGSFMMGSSRSAAQLAKEEEESGFLHDFAGELPQHQVRISEGFCMGQTEVTQGQYKSVMNAQPWSGQDNVQEDANNPAVLVTWDDAAAFCTKLSQQEGKTYRLPTEAEWEYACRAGTTTRFSFGDSGSSLGDYAWCRSNTYEADQKYAHPVGQKKPNPWALYDMHGNVYEWCSDYYDEDYYSNSPNVDPKGPPTGFFRSLRGGSWGYYGDYLRCSVRVGTHPVSLINIIGFRVVRSQPPVKKPQEATAEEPGSKPVLEEATRERLVKQQEEQNTRQPKQGDVVTNSIGMKLVYIPAGSFMMGSSRSAAQLAREYDTKEVYFTAEFPQHQVRISEGFWMGQTEVTQGQYKSVLNAQPWSGRGGVQEDTYNPAVYVIWDEAVEFCTKLSQQESKTYRLPTDAEWEYACRAGTTTRFSFGDSESSLGDYAWFYGNAVKVGEKYTHPTHPVGQKKPNPWGLYDMHGNVWEWCSDWYDKDYYSNSPSVDPKGPPTGTFRSLRGGSWDDDEVNLRCSPRDGLNPFVRNYVIGFRVVRSQ